MSSREYFDEQKYIEKYGDNLQPSRKIMLRDYLGLLYRFLAKQEHIDRDGFRILEVEKGGYLMLQPLLRSQEPNKTSAKNIYKDYLEILDEINSTEGESDNENITIKTNNKKQKGKLKQREKPKIEIVNSRYDNNNYVNFYLTPFYLHKVD